ncbi:TolC family protein [Desulfobacterota bacterium AH_259_B03_O07]|nr:TolC family protein [Desulfobacterota bacterium AH_259_B03_O07]
MTPILLLLISLFGIQEVLNLSLDDVRIITLENNRDIQIERKNVEISLGEVQKQTGVFDPLLNVGSSYTDAYIPTTSTFIQSGVIHEKVFDVGANVEGTLPTGTFYDILDFSITRTETDSAITDLSPGWFNTLGFTIGQDLLKNFGVEVNRTPIIVASRNNEISDKELVKRISEILLEVERSYWLLVSAEENLELALTALELAKDLQRRNEIQVEVGVLPPVAVTQAKAEVAAREVDLIRAENELRAAEDNLKNILAMPLTTKISAIDEPTTVFQSFNEDEVLGEALEKRPEMQQAKLEIENRETLKKFFSNQKLPRFAIEGSVELQGLGGAENPDRASFSGVIEPVPERFLGAGKAFSSLFEGDFPTWQILGVFTFPLFNRAARGDYVKASAEVDRSIIFFKRVTEDVSLDVRNAIRNVKDSIRGIEAARVAVGLDEEVLENEEQRLEVGIGTTRSVLEAQRDLVDERTREIGAITGYNTALAELEFARGTILESSAFEFQE